MATQYACEFKGRVAALRRAGSASPGTLLNGIEYLEVGPDHRTLFVHFVHDLALVPSVALQPSNIEIRGGQRVRDPDVVGVQFTGNVLTVDVATAGDFSTYRLRLIRPGNRDLPPEGIDIALAEVAFSFKVDCPSDFDCKVIHECPPEEAERPQIDYLAKDYASFRRVMLDRLAALLPNWRERSPADLTLALVETLAFRADELSYYQDAVAAEAYLGTARRRISVRRHARLLDYPFHDGCNSRVWVAFEVERNSAADGAVLDKGTQLLTRIAGHESARVATKTASEVLDTGRVQPFELVESTTLRALHSRMQFYTWSDEECCLPAGATRCFLEDDVANRLTLGVGDVLILEEAGDVETRAHAVRLTYVDPEPGGAERRDLVTGQCYVEVRWDVRDALPFPLCLSRREDGTLQINGAAPGEGGALDDSAMAPGIGGLRENIAVALGNVALADHGRTMKPQRLPQPQDPRRYRPLLSGTTIAPLTAQGRISHAAVESPQIFDSSAPAAAAFDWQLESVLPAIDVINARDGSRWTPRDDLIESHRFEPVFVVETEADGRAYLRFGDDINGRGVRFDDDLTARCRIGNGRAGNVGAGSIRHVVTALEGIETARNPLPARGGEDPHSLEQAKLYAPQAFRRQERAVTLEDYARIAERHSEVQRAVATRRWTGSWHTIFLTVDRRGGAAVDAEFETGLLGFLERYRLAGHDLEIDGPSFVPLDLALEICAQPGHFPSDVKERLLRAFSRDVLPDGSRGFFHPDRFTFATPVYLSEVIARAMQVPGVDFVQPKRFQRWGRTTAGELGNGVIRMGTLEIARLDNDANAPEQGRIELSVHPSAEARLQ